MIRPLRVTASLMSRIQALADEAASDECMGLLASPPASAVVTEICPLVAEASPGHAEADPLVIKEAAKELRDRGLVPCGIWHSHGHSGVFHSGTDHDTINRLLPGMAAWNFDRPRPAAAAPCVTAPDAAVLPLADGRSMVFSLSGAPIAGTDFRERALWGRVATEFVANGSEPRALLDARHLRLEGGGVALILEVPESAAVESRIEDTAGVRVARLHSLVVNTRGDRTAECLLVLEFAGECFTHREPCELVEVDGGASATPRRARGFWQRLGG